MSPRITLIHAVQVAIPPVLEAFREGWPEAEVSSLLDDVLKPDEAMFDDALSTGLRIGVVATFPGTIPVAEPQIRAMAAARGLDAKIVSAVAPEAFKAMNAGDIATHDRLVVDAAASIASRVDVLCLAQFSMARARSAVQATVGVPVLTSPTAAVQRLRSLLS